MAEEEADPLGDAPPTAPPPAVPSSSSEPVASKDPISCALSLMRRMPPNKIEHNLSGLLNLIPEHTDELLQRVDQPLEEAMDAATGRAYLLCDYNRDGDSYRSPWSNTYEPPIDDGFVPSPKLRAMEIEANQLFDAYRELYFEGGTSSVYLWDLDEASGKGAFAGCFLIKKAVSGHRFVSDGAWDSIHVAEVLPDDGDATATYKLTTTVMLSMDVKHAADQVGDSNLSGSLTRAAEKKGVPVDAARPHLANLGTMIEDMETDIRTYLDALYIQKTREVVSSIRKLRATGMPTQGQPFTMNLNAAVLKHGANRKIDSES